MPNGRGPRQVICIPTKTCMPRASKIWELHPCEKGKLGLNNFKYFSSSETLIYTQVRRHYANNVSCPKTLYPVFRLGPLKIQSIRPSCLLWQVTGQIKRKIRNTYHTIPQATCLALMIRCQSDVASWYKCTSMEIPIWNRRSST